jgi:hypothetical protein
MVSAVLVRAGFTIFIHSGVGSRMEAKEKSAEHVRPGAIPRMAVIHPETGSAAQEIELPGITGSDVRAEGLRPPSI